VTLPPLRERTEDIPLLVRFFAQKFASRMGKQILSISAETSAALLRYHWPGNGRELENVIERAVILSQGPDLEIPLSQLKPQSLAPSVPSPPSHQPQGRAENSSTLENIERQHIVRVLQETGWIVSGPTGAAARLGMKRTTLQARMRKLGISRQM
jgi:formate hydrogenlyase transcriptional activator